MLPDFPRIKSERADRLMKRAHTESRAKHAILPKLSTVMQPEGDAVNLTDVEGRTAMSGYEQFRSKLEVTLDELPKLDDEAWFEKFTRMTDELADEEMKLLIHRMNEVTTEAGNVVDAKGQALSEDHLLQIIDRVQLDFEDGRLSPDFALLTSPEMGKRLSELSVSDSFKERHARIIERQFSDWRLRQADRKLVD